VKGEKAMRMVRVPWQTSFSEARIDHDGVAGRAVSKALRWLSVIASLGMCLVLQQGTLVTNSGSAAGCGNTWPLCHGKILPEFSGVSGAATAIEFSHRVAVPIESTLVIALAAGMFWFWRDRREALVLAPAMIFFLFLQAVLGAMAVAWPTSAEVLAAHFGISLLAFASIVLAAAFVWEVGGTEVLRDRPLSAPIRWAIRGTLVYMYIVVYLGAYVRHVGASLSWLDWPRCSGRVIPRFVGGVAAQFTHRVGAGLLVLCIAGLFAAIWTIRKQRPDLFRASAACVVLVILQALSGALVVETRITVVSTLIHAFFVSLLFVVEAYMWLHTIERPAGAGERAPGWPNLAARRLQRTARV
jgi:cytochrome c oxidase assembly protein subunit 15